MRPTEMNALSLTPREQLMNWVCANPESWQLDIPNDEHLSLLQNWIFEHRLGGWLYWRFQQADCLDLIPSELRAKLRSQFKETTRKALLQRCELQQTINLLAQAGIPSVALKGSYLQRYIFPHQGLRPMRDLDILVPKQFFRQAWEKLQEAGYHFAKGVTTDPESLLPIQNQIALRSPNRIKVELHRAVGWELPVEISTLPNFWQNESRLCIQREGISYLCPELLYIHLCVHHSWQHHWDIGPLGWVDLHLMSQSQQIDRVKMMQLAAQLQLESQIDTALQIYQQTQQTAATGMGDLSLLFLPPSHDLGDFHKLNRLETYSWQRAIARKLTVLDPKITPDLTWKARWGGLLRHFAQWLWSRDRHREFATRLSYNWNQKLNANGEISCFRHQLQLWYDLDRR